MDVRSLIDRVRQAGDIDQILRQQLLWMLLLRIVLYTVLMGLSDLFQNTRFEVIVLPRNLLVLFLLLVYLTTIISAILLLTLPGNLRVFGFLQNLLDTFFASLLVFYTGASHSTFTSVYFFPIIAGGLILPRKGGLVAAASSTLQYGLILFLELLGFFPSYLSYYGFKAASNPMVSLNHFGILGLTFFLAALLSALFGLRLRKTENALSDSILNFDRLATLYKQIFDNISTGILTIDAHGVITSANNATAAITGYRIEQLVGSKLQTYFPNLQPTTTELRPSADFTKQDGTLIKLGYSHMVLNHPDDAAQTATDGNKIITLRDISEIERLENQMRQAEKLAAIGMMSASIAHDFRNPLTAISGSAQVLAREFSKSTASDPTNLELTDIIIRESNRLITTISEFLRFSRPETANREWFSLHTCLAEVVQVCEASPQWPATCSIQFTIDHNFDIWADRRQMFTVLSHLIHNAVAFCPPGREVIEIDSGEVRLPNGQEGIAISVSDNGSGVEEKNREKIFEPFFTSRPDGTGLGLAIVRQTIEEHHGTIAVDTSRRGGARFTLQLPLPA
jgi:two-component system, NtrC family, sensor histidine kinase PilS